MNKWIWLSTEILFSKEYMSLTKTERNVYHILLYKRQTTRNKKGVTKIINNGSIQFTEEEAKKKWEIKPASFKRAIKGLKAKGIIRLAGKVRATNNLVCLYEIMGIFRSIKPKRNA